MATHGRDMYHAGLCRHECSTDEQRRQWDAEALAQQVIGRQLREDGELRDACENIDQEHGWDGGR